MQTNNVVKLREACDRCKAPIIPAIGYINISWEGYYSKRVKWNAHLCKNCTQKFYEFMSKEIKEN